MCVNTSIVTGLYATLWKHSLVVPAFKSGDFDDPSNFRPISILPVISKILERIVADQLMEYLEANKLISNTQHGFRSKLSTETALLAITEKIYENMDNNKISLLSLLDLSKAFDSVNHELLLEKLQKVYHKKVVPMRSWDIKNPINFLFAFMIFASKNALFKSSFHSLQSMFQRYST